METFHICLWPIVSFSTLILTASKRSNLLCGLQSSSRTYGMSISSGIFIPTLLTGAAWGRIVGTLLYRFFPDMDWGDVGKYSLIGASAQLSGTIRLTYSLTAIILEATGSNPILCSHFSVKIFYARFSSVMIGCLNFLIPILFSSTFSHQNKLGRLLEELIFNWNVPEKTSFRSHDYFYQFVPPEWTIF